MRRFAPPNVNFSRSRRVGCILQLTVLGASLHSIHHLSLAACRSSEVMTFACPCLPRSWCVGTNARIVEVRFLTFIGTVIVRFRVCVPWIIRASQDVIWFRFVSGSDLVRIYFPCGHVHWLCNSFFVMHVTHSASGREPTVLGGLCSSPTGAIYLCTYVACSHVHIHAMLFLTFGTCRFCIHVPLNASVDFYGLQRLTAHRPREKPLLFTMSESGSASPDHTPKNAKASDTDTTSSTRSPSSMHLPWSEDDHHSDGAAAAASDALSDDKSENEHCSICSYYGCCCIFSDSDHCCFFSDSDHDEDDAGEPSDDDHDHDDGETSGPESETLEYERPQHVVAVPVPIADGDDVRLPLVALPSPPGEEQLQLALLFDGAAVAGPPHGPHNAIFREEILDGEDIIPGLTDMHGRMETLHDHYPRVAVKVTPSSLRPGTILHRKPSKWRVETYVRRLSKGSVQEQSQLVVFLAMSWPTCWAAVHKVMCERRAARFAKARGFDQRVRNGVLRGEISVDRGRELIKSNNRMKFMHFH